MRNKKAAFFFEKKVLPHGRGRGRGVRPGRAHARGQYSQPLLHKAALLLSLLQPA